MTNEEMQQSAKDHLWLHFTNMGIYQDEEIPVITHGEGCYVYDTNGKKYIDGLAGLFTSQIGHGRKEIATAVAEQTKKLGYFPIWSYGHPGAIELAERVAKLAPGDLNHVYFVNGGGEAVESAWKIARQYHQLKGDHKRYKVISRNLSYHGTTLGALSIVGATTVKTAFEPLVPGACKVENTDTYRSRHLNDTDDELAFAKKCALDIERAIEIEGPETVAAIFLEPVQNVGGCLVPPKGYWQEVRKICDKYGVLLVSDEVICAFGRLGYMFGCERFDYQPDIITCAKGITSGFVPMGAVIASDFIYDEFIKHDTMFLSGTTFGGHPVACAAALANLDVFDKEKILENVRENEAFFKSELEKLKALPIVGDVRGCGYFYGIELVKNKETREAFNEEESKEILFKFLSPRIFEAGLICRADDRGEPVIQLSPPLVAGKKEIKEMCDILHRCISEAVEKVANI
jgi:adenosylmethionine-8-amino-7-oxononanoate aminotransferase